MRNITDVAEFWDRVQRVVLGVSGRK